MAAGYPEWRACCRYVDAYYEASYRGEIDTWDFAWTFACWVQNGFPIHPNKNLVSNIGFGTDATHTTGSEDRLANMKNGMSFPLSHPPFVIQDRQADSIVQRDFFDHPTIPERVRGKMKAFLRKG